MTKAKSYVIGFVLIIILFMVAALVVGYIPDAMKQRSGFEATKAKERRRQDREWEKKQYIKRKQLEALDQLDKDVAEGRPSAWDRYWDRLMGK